VFNYPCARSSHYEDHGVIFLQSQIEASLQPLIVRPKAEASGMTLAAVDPLGLCVGAPDDCPVTTADRLIMYIKPHRVQPPSLFS
jgi:hypothetical protein